MAEDRWLRWQAEAAGTADHPHTITVLVVFLAVTLAALLWLPRSGAAEPPSTTRATSPCAELRELERAGVHSGPDWWALQPRCHAGR